jgi:hypothetical protein
LEDGGQAGPPPVLDDIVNDGNVHG